MNARLHIQTAVRNGITYLKESYYTPPFKVANITEEKQAAPLHLMLMCSSPGVLEGDDYQIKINIEEDSRLHLHTQSYQRLFNMKNGARQNMEVYLQKGADLVYIPHPAVPHKQAIFTTRNKIYLQGNNRLIWGESLTCGRKLNGEQFDFVKYHSITDVFMNGRLAIRENWLVQPGITPVAALGQWEGFSHQASLIILDKAEIIPLHYKAINNFLLQQKEITYGISTLPNDGIIIRLLGYKAEQLLNCQNGIAALVTAHNHSLLKTPRAHVD
jgi:urease accessory protein